MVFVAFAFESVELLRPSWTASHARSVHLGGGACDRCQLSGCLYSRPCDRPTWSCLPASAGCWRRCYSGFWRYPAIRSSLLPGGRTAKDAGSRYLTLESEVDSVYDFAGSREPCSRSEEH